MATIMAAIDFIPVSREAIYKRVNRVLSRRGEKIVAGLGHSRQVTGNWYLVNLATGQITGVYLDIENVARSLGVMQPYEKLGECSE
jgi:hypothetical protein